MKLTIESEQLKKAVQSVTKCTLPSDVRLSGICVEVHGEAVTISANNGSISASVNRTISEEHEDGMVVLSKTQFGNLVSTLPEGLIEIISENDTVMITWNGGKSTIPVEVENECYLHAPIPTEEATMIMKASDFINAMSMTVGCTDHSGVYPNMEHILIEKENDNQVAFVSSNRTILIAVTKDVTLTPDQHIMIHSSVAPLLNNLIPDSESDIEIIADAKNIFIRQKDITLSTRKCEGKFPNWRSILPKDTTVTVSTNTSDFLASIKRVSIFIDSVRPMVNIHNEGENFRIEGENPMFGMKALETCGCQCDEGNEIKGKYNPELLKLGLKRKSKNIKLSYKGECYPLLIESESDESITFMIMPYR